MREGIAIQRERPEAVTTEAAGENRVTPPEEVEKTISPVPRCPNCGWLDVRPSRVRGVLDTLCGVMSMRPFRCRSCGHRFYRPRRPYYEA